MKVRKTYKWIFIALLLVIAIVVIYPTYRFYFSKKTIQVDDKLTIIKGGGGNSGLLVTDSAIVVIDTKMAGPAKKLYDLAKEKAGKKPIIVINTHFHGDHSNGNYLYIGCKKYIGAYETAFLEAKMKKENRPDILVSDSLVLDFGDEKIFLYDLGQAHTFNDLAVYLANRKILFAGDVVFNRIHPALFRKEGTDINKWMIVLERVISQWEIQTLVPGHGLPGGKELAIQMKQYFADMKMAAADPAIEKEMISKYYDWTRISGMTSGENTIQFLKESPE
jgi:cyclase